ncbi:malolactic enzyme [Bacillus subtilis]|uniref:Malolactic enzyme n=1 Tax=Bacillus subtilis TaxID=1423 RepID=A0A0D1L6W1_BACIU|nr:malolactic enzyme [Bacillus subtilis]
MSQQQRPSQLAQGDVVPQPLDSKVHHAVAAAVEHAALTAVK